MFVRFVLARFEPGGAGALGSLCAEARRSFVGCTVEVGLPSDDRSAQSWDLAVVIRAPERGVLDAAWESSAWFARLQAEAQVVKTWAFGLET